MTDLKDLVEKIKNLEKLTAEEQPQQIKLLQEIGKELLTEYVIKVGDITIKPLWVEAYYSDANTGFVDTSVHGDECQKQYDVLYFHHKTDDPRSGVDICLSFGDYYLSYLLKYTLVNGVFKSQAQLSSMIPQELRNAKNVLVKESNPTDVIVCTRRIGIKSSEYKDKELAIARDINQRFVTESGEKKSLPQKIGC